MSSDGTRGERSDDPTEAGEDPEAVRGEKTNKKGKKKDDSDMVVDGADSQKAKGTKRKETGNPEGNDPPEDDESEDEGRKKNNKNDDEDDFSRLARESELLRAFLQKANTK